MKQTAIATIRANLGDAGDMNKRLLGVLEDTPAQTLVDCSLLARCRNVRLYSEMIPPARP